MPTPVLADQYEDWPTVRLDHLIPDETLFHPGHQAAVAEVSE